MKVTFNAKITVKEMYRFQMYNAYSKFMGVVMFLFGIACFVVVVITFGKIEIPSSFLLALLGSLYTIIQPILLWRGAKRQINKNPVYQNEICYTVDDSGITVSQGESTTFKAWEECWKARDFGKIAVIYIAVNNGVIMPKAAIGAQYNDFVAVVNAHLPSNLKARG